MQSVPEYIAQHRLQHVCRAVPAYGEGVAKALSLDVKLDAAE